MPAEAFVIRELTGSRREVRLTGRALPHRPAAFGGTQANVQTWYPGNNVATLQVLGARESNLHLTGRWASSKLVGAVALTGFDDIPSDGGTILAEDLVKVFNRLRIAGNTLEVMWGPEVRRGILATFDPSYQRVEDVDWTMEFVWSQRGDEQPSRAAAPENPVQTTQAAMNAVSDVAAQEPPGLVANAVSAVRAGVGTLRRGISTFTQTVSQIQTTAEVASARVQQLQSITETVVNTGRAIRKGSLDLPYTALLPIDDVVQVLRAENWRMDLGRNTRRTQSAAVRGRNDVARRAVPGYLAIVTLRENQTLRSLANDYYGSADAWTTIADANDIVGSYAAPGTVLVIPRAPTSGSGATT